MTYSTEPARVLAADCPWRFNDDLPGPKRGAASHYSCMSVEDLCAFPLPPLEPDCWLAFWRVASMQAEALEVVAAWGFHVVAEIVWVKTTDDGEVIRIGMGRSVRMAHEVCLICKRGRPARAAADVPSVFFAPRGAHSAKPDKFYELIERLADGPRVELFARVRRPGWECFGDELPAKTKATMPRSHPTPPSKGDLTILLPLIELVLAPPAFTEDQFDTHPTIGSAEGKALQQHRRALLIQAFGKDLSEYDDLEMLENNIVMALRDLPTEQARGFAQRLIGNIFDLRTTRLRDVAGDAFKLVKDAKEQARKASKAGHAKKAAKTSPATKKPTSKPASKPGKPKRGEWKLGDRCIGTTATAANCKPETPASELIGRPGTICHLDSDGVRGMVLFEGHKKQLGITLSTLVRPSQKGVPEAKPAKAKASSRANGKAPDAEATAGGAP